MITADTFSVKPSRIEPGLGDCSSTTRNKSMTTRNKSKTLPQSGEQATPTTGLVGIRDSTIWSNGAVVY